MRILLCLLVAGSLSASAAAAEALQKNCHCIDCHCTPEAHCGCKSEAKDESPAPPEGSANEGKVKPA